MTVVGARVHEALPVLRHVRPALVLTVLGTLLALGNTHRGVIDRAVRQPAFRATLVYFAWATITVPFALWQAMAFEAWQGLVPITLVMLLILLCPPTAATLDRLQFGLVVACAATGVASIVIGNSMDGRLSGFGSFDPNDLAGVMALSLPFALGLLVRGRGFVRLIGAGSAVILVLTLVRTASRGGFIALAVAVTLFVLGQPGARKGILILVTIVASAVVWQTGPESFRERIGSFLGGEEDYNYTEYGGRKQIWDRGIGYALANPILGVGLGNFPEAEGRACRKIFPSGCRWTAPHNAYIQSASELGFPGLALFCVVLVTTVRAAFRFWRPSSARLPGGYARHRPEMLAAIGGFYASAVFLSHAYFYLQFILVAYIALASMAVEIGVLGPLAGHMPFLVHRPAWGRRGRLRRLAPPAERRPALPAPSARPGRRGGLSIGA